MISIDYPPQLVQRIFSQEAPGGVPASVSLIVPTVTRVGEPFTLKIAVLDSLGYPSVCCIEPVRIDGLPVVQFHDGQPAIAAIQGITINQAGLHRMEARLGNERFFSNPTLCTSQPAQAIYWGDPHCHSALGYCMPATCRSLNYLFCAARYLSGLDWVAATDHVSNGRGDPGKWKDQCAVSELFHDPPAFVTIPAYEASFKGGAGGDHNVYMSRFPDMFVDDYDNGSVRTLCRMLREQNPELDFFVVPHHTTRTNKHGEISDDIYVGPELSPVIEIHSKWGTSEYRGNPNPLQKVHSGNSYVIDFLGRGMRFGFVGGTDSHASMPGGRGVEPAHIDRLPGLTATRTSVLTREEIYSAIKHRRCYASSLERIYLDVSIVNSPEGQSAAWPKLSSPRTLRITAAAQSDIVSIEVVRNGVTIHTHPVHRWHESFEWIDEQSLAGQTLESSYLGRFAYYYVRVNCTSGAKAWSSPMWLLLDKAEAR